MEFRDLKEQYRRLKADIDRALVETATSGQFIMGGAVKELETELAQYVGVRHCISCANGTDALTLALKAWGIGAGDAVFVPDFTFFSSAEIVALEGATPIFVDVCPETFNLDPESLKKAITAVRNEGRLKPKAVVAVDLFGLPADFATIRNLACEEHLFLLEDGAQGFGGSIDNQRACSFGDIATTSFFPAKPLGCYGDGGAVFTDNDEWAALIQSYRVHGKGSDKYDNVRIGLNSRLDTIQAAILKVKLAAFRSYELQAVNHAASQYGQRLNGLGNLLTSPLVPSRFGSSWAQYTIRICDKATRSELQAFLKNNGIPSMIYYPTPMCRQTAFVQYKKYVETPVAQHLCDTVLSLPMHPYLTTPDINCICGHIADFFRQHSKQS